MPSPALGLGGAQEQGTQGLSSHGILHLAGKRDTSKHPQNKCPMWKNLRAIEISLSLGGRREILVSLVMGASTMFIDLFVHPALQLVSELLRNGACVLITYRKPGPSRGAHT